MTLGGPAPKFKVLFTGSRTRLFKDESSLFSEDDGTFLKSDQTLAAVYLAMRDMGYELEGPRPIGFMEDLDQYDFVVAEASVADTHGQDHLMGLLWAMQRSHVLLVVGHWDVRSIYGSYATLARKPEKMFSGFIRYFDNDRYQREMGIDWAVDNLERILESKIPSAINVYPWGDHSLLTPKHLEGGFKYFFDPTSYVVSPPVVDIKPDDRLRVWTTGTYEPFADKQFAKENPSWPHRVFGCEKNGHMKLTPEELYSFLRHSWGSIVHKYHHDGSGYYRSRYQQLANLGVIAAVLGEKDRESMGSPYGLSVRAIEGLDNLGLTALATDQREWFYENTWNKERLQLELNHIACGMA